MPDLWNPAFFLFLFNSCWFPALCIQVFVIPCISWVSVQLNIVQISFYGECSLFSLTCTWYMNVKGYIDKGSYSHVLPWSWQNSKCGYNLVFKLGLNFFQHSRGTAMRLKGEANMFTWSQRTIHQLHLLFYIIALRKPLLHQALSITVRHVHIHVRPHFIIEREYVRISRGVGIFKALKISYHVSRQIQVWKRIDKILQIEKKVNTFLK